MRASVVLQVELLLSLSSLLVFSGHAQDSFNYEVERRIFERVDDYMGGPITANNLFGPQQWRSRPGDVSSKSGCICSS